MIKHTLKRMMRAPVEALAVLLFGAIIAGAICGLHAANEEAARNYETVYHTIPVKLTVTNLSATRSTDLEAPGWVLDVFTGESVYPRDISAYVKDISVKCSHRIDKVNGISVAANLVGISRLESVGELSSESGGSVNWWDGYDETAFDQGGAVCIVPESMLGLLEEGTTELVMDFSYTQEYGYKETVERQYTLAVAGTYSGSGSVYCPYRQVEQVYISLGEEREIDSLSATLVDNDLLEELRSVSTYWFPAPNAKGTQTPWGKYGFEYYPYALDINDDLLVKTATTMQNTITVNRVCGAVIYVLSAGAGFLIGFLMVRSRKREIALMRTMGTPDSSIYFGFVLEQMLCVVVGIALGGAYNRWEPIERLGILAAIYFVGLTAALVIFLRKNLLTTIKEDE